jgi:hypothetical protein
MSLSSRKAKELIERAVSEQDEESEIGSDALIALCERIYMIESTYSSSAQQIKSDIRDRIVKAVDSNI